jgi:hypothetical protein
VVLVVTPTGENLINNYGKVTMAKFMARATIYFTAPLARPAQNYASLTNAAQTKTNLHKYAFTVLNHKDGLCFLKSIIAEADLLDQIHQMTFLQLQTQ